MSDHGLTLKRHDTVKEPLNNNLEMFKCSAMLCVLQEYHQCMENRSDLRRNEWMKCWKILPSAFLSPNVMNGNSCSSNRVYRWQTFQYLTLLLAFDGVPEEDLRWKKLFILLTEDLNHEGETWKDHKLVSCIKLPKISTSSPITVIRLAEIQGLDHKVLDEK
ncbi:hypothetical protein CEXT_503471 [Caerostris extrusa]|uniref:Uncharacterized protein n=1 Tax=Caerostris extrusa TaxID=172846 RepID=A0AAV4V198_CAEEX|nr:hypothetical protein CEXT_503471 [Caerostris extrusa]